MSDLYLDLRDRLAVIDFILQETEYLDPKDPLRIEANQTLEDISAHESISMEDLADLARRVGRETWVPRVAVERYVATPDGADEEFRRIASSVSKSTGHLLERARLGRKPKSLTDILRDDSSKVAFGDSERIEIEELRSHILPSLWHEKRDEMKKLVAEADETLREIEMRIKALRELAFSSPALESELKSKIERLEDRLYFEGEVLNPERMDEEVALYREEKALPSSFKGAAGWSD